MKKKETKKQLKKELLTGEFCGTQKGFGFVSVEGEEEDYFISADHTKDAFPGDIVRIEVFQGKSGRSREARVVEIVEHAIKTVVGTYERPPRKSYGFVIPDNTKLPCDIFIPKESEMGAVDGHKVVAEIVDYGDAKHSPEGRITEILGHRNDPGVDILSIVKAYDIPVEFPENVLNQAVRVSTPVTQGDIDYRKDLRNLQMITIDGEDAKDLDDAVSLSFDGTFYHLGVHIADVTNYVQENSALDKEALKRGTSVYLVDRVIPMLPHALSNGICSLNEGEERMAISCLMTIDGKGEIVDHELFEAVIRVDHRMSYTQVKKLLEDPEADALREEYADIMPMVTAMRDCAALLRKKRKARGSIDFDFPECKILVDSNGKPLEIKPYERNVATNLIEDFMLAANETVATHFYWNEAPFVYRVHGTPDAEKLDRLLTMLRGMGYYMKTVDSEAHPKEFQKLLEKIDGTAEENFISRLLLRSMKQAKYSTECTGHFGLACNYYCHFTSPIRRYPDLQIHRIIKDELRGNLSERKVRHYNEILPKVAENSSTLERRAEEAERETDKLKKVQYMSRYIGEAFDGIISGVTGFGLFVELESTVEGLVRMNSLVDDFYQYDETKMELVGNLTGKVYKLGMPVRVVVDDVDLQAKTIDFHLILPDEQSQEEV